jgi:hypothetical protein
MRVKILFVTLWLTAAFSFGDPEKSHVVRDGSTVERAVIMRAPSTHEAVRLEWKWIEEHHPFASALSWMHLTICDHHMLYDRYILDTQVGKRDVYFALTEKCD